MEEIRDEFMKNIGGQTHVKCAEHRCPLISSMHRNHKCACGSKEFLRCCNYKCKVFLCRRCFKNKPLGTTTFVASPEYVAAGGNGNDEDGEDCYSDNSSHQSYSILNVKVHVPESADKIGFVFSQKKGTTGNIWVSSIKPGTPADNINNWSQTIVNARILKYNNEDITCMKDIKRISHQILESKPITFEAEFAIVKEDNELDDYDDEGDNCDDDNSDKESEYQYSEEDNEYNSSEDDSSNSNYSDKEAEDNIDDFLMSTLHEDIDINESDNDESGNEDGIYFVDDEAYGTEIQTTDAGAYA